MSQRQIKIIKGGVKQKPQIESKPVQLSITVVKETWLQSALNNIRAAKMQESNLFYSK